MSKLWLFIALSVFLVFGCKPENGSTNVLLGRTNPIIAKNENTPQKPDIKAEVQTQTPSNTNAENDVTIDKQNTSAPPEQVMDKVSKPELVKESPAVNDSGHIEVIHAVQENPKQPELPPLKQNPAQAKAFNTVTKMIDTNKPWSPSYHRGKVIVLDFWATWCVPCKQIEPALKNIYDKYGQRDDFVLAGIAMEGSDATIRNYTKKHDIKWTQLYEPVEAWNNSLARAFGVQSIPFLVLINKDGAMERLGNMNQIEQALKK